MKNLNQKGQGMTEYILIVALIAVVVIGAVKFFGHKTGEGFNSAANDLSNSVQAGHNDSTNNGSGYGK